MRGEIKLELLNEQDTFVMNLTSAEDTMAIVGIPHSAAKITRIEANEIPVWYHDKRKNKVNGVTFLENTADYIKFSVEPGKWFLKAKKNTPNNSIQGIRQTAPGMLNVLLKEKQL